MVTYWFELALGLNFLTSANLKVILARNDHSFDPANPFSCLLDKSCTLATMGHKNQLKIDVILTSGLYKLMIIEDEGQDMGKFLTEECGLHGKPITFEITSYPIL